MAGPFTDRDIDTHPLVREYFGEQLRSQQTEAWKESNRRLYNYYRTLAPELPESFRDMEPLFLAVICGCNAGLFRQALHEVYIPRIQRGDASFAAKVLGARGALLSVLVHFFEEGRWGSRVKKGVKGQRLTAEDQLFILMQAGMHLTVTRGYSAPEARICYEDAEPLGISLNRPLALFSALIGQWRYSLLTDTLMRTMEIAKRVYALAQGQNDSALMIGSYHALAGTVYFIGDFDAARRYAEHGAQLWRAGGVDSHAEELLAPTVACLFYGALSEWHLGQITSCKAIMAQAISLAKEPNDTYTLAVALWHAAVLGHLERNPAEVQRLVSDLIELSTRHTFAFCLAGGKVLGGWARSASRNTADGIAWIEDGIRDYRATGSMLRLPYFLALKAEALHLADRTCEALQTIKEAERLAETFGERWWCAEMYRLRGVFLAAMGTEKAKIEAAFQDAVRTAKQQKSVSLVTRAEASYTEYRRKRREPLRGHRLN